MVEGEANSTKQYSEFHMHVALITFAKIHTALKKTFCIKKKKITYGAFLVIPISCLGSEQFPTIR